MTAIHLGQTIINDYGRPYAPGFNNITGFSTLSEKGRFSSTCVRSINMRLLHRGTRLRW